MTFRLIYLIFIQISNDFIVYFLYLFYKSIGLEDTFHATNETPMNNDSMNNQPGTFENTVWTPLESTKLLRTTVNGKT